jgi:nucleoside-diphosphate-sugar epimerase
MPRVLVTGAAGFVGRAVVRSLLANTQVEVVATCRGPADSVGQPQARLSVVPHVDLAEASAVSRLPRDCTHVIHAAALARFEGSSRQALHQANVHATDLLLQHVAGTSPALDRFVYISTFGVHDRPRFYDVSSPIREGSPFAAVSEYGRSKRQAEERVGRGGVPHAIARLAWVYGPSMRRDSHIRVLGGMCRRGHPLTRIDFPGRVSVAYVDDVADAVAGLAMKPRLAEQVYLVAHQTPVSFGEMFAQFSRLFDPPVGTPRARVPWLVAPMRLAAPLIGMKLRSLVEDYYVCDPSRLAAEGLALRMSFADGLRRSVIDGGWAAD